MATYDTIDNPYSNQLLRPESEVSAAATGVDVNAGGPSVLTGQALTDAWISTFIKSTNYSPKKMGFLIDGLRGYIEGMSMWISGSIVGGSLDIPDQLSANSFHVDANGNTWWGSPTAGGYTLGKASIQANGIATFGPSTGSRVVINGNDLYLYNDLGAPENSASINFLRTDANPGTFIINKRKSAVSSLGNVMEMFFSDIPAGSVRNYLFLGRSGTAASITDYKTHVISIDPRQLVQINTDAVYNTGWVSPPGSEIQMFTTDWDPAGYIPFDAGASRVQIGAITGAADNPLNWGTGGGGGCVLIGVQDQSGPNYSLVIDKLGNWLWNDSFPVTTNSFVLGDSTHVFLDFHTNSIQIREASNTLYGTIDTNAGWWSFTGNNRNFLFAAGGGHSVFVNADAIAPQFSGSGSCGLSSHYWSNVYTNNVTLSSSYINFQSGAITLHSDTSIQGTLRATGALECTTARVRVGTTDFYVTPDPDAPGKFYLRS